MKGWCVFVIPGRLRDRDTSIRVKRVPKERDLAVEAEEHRRRAINGKVGPLTLDLDPQIGPALLVSRFQAPTFHEGTHDLLSGLRLICGKQRLWGGRLPWGSQVRTQRIGKGSYPARYHKAIPVHTSSVRSPCW